MAFLSYMVAVYFDLCIHFTFESDNIALFFRFASFMVLCDLVHVDFDFDRL
ncbi:hypothetical protein D3C85_1603070 [compost metagenome]